MEQEGSRELENPGEDYSGWPLRQRLELLAFDARLPGVPQAPLEALREALDQLPTGCKPERRGADDPDRGIRRFAGTVGLRGRL
jgi:hypothetical protein